MSLSSLREREKDWKIKAEHQATIAIEKQGGETKKKLTLKIDKNKKFKVKKIYLRKMQRLVVKPVRLATAVCNEDNWRRLLCCRYFT